jgi:energy-coupling factor transport system permease protein
MKFTPPVADPTAVLARRNPTAKLAAAMVLTLLLVISLDPVTPVLVLAVEVAVLPLFGLRYARLLRRMWPLTVAAGLSAASYLFFAERTGEVLVSLGPLTVTTGTVDSAVSLFLRLFAIALPGIMVFASTDPTDLADSLVQNAKAPPRFVLGALAAIRLLPLLANDWEMLRLARRARGVDGGRNPAAHLRLFASTVFGLLVVAIRRGTRLATAMDARGFDSGTARTAARSQRFGLADFALIVAAAILGAAGIATSVAAGTFDPLFA